MTLQDDLRNRVKNFKRKSNNIYYKDIANLLKMNENSFYNWLCGYSNLSISKLNRLKEILYKLEK